MTGSEFRLAGVELGGTKAIVVLGKGDEIINRARIPIGAPETTLGAIRELLDRWEEEGPIDALGIASFGPVGVIAGRDDYGRLLKTPKPGWSGIDILGSLSPAIGGPATIHTDVTAAALAEGEWGAARGCADHAYMTVGTGIGIGIISGGRPIVGQLHPEGGHVRVSRLAGDEFQGSCPFHGDCLEGLASGPAIAARTGHEGGSLCDDDPAWEPVVDALAEAAANLFLTLSSDRIVMGGGVINQRTWLVERIARRCSEKLGGYLPYIGDFAPILPAALGEDAGPRGALFLARACLSDRY